MDVEKTNRCWLYRPSDQLSCVRQSKWSPGQPAWSDLIHWPAGWHTYRAHARWLTDWCDDVGRRPAQLAPDRPRRRPFVVSSPAARGHTLPVAPYRPSVRPPVYLLVRGVLIWTIRVGCSSWLDAPAVLAGTPRRAGDLCGRSASTNHWSLAHCLCLSFDVITA